MVLHLHWLYPVIAGGSSVHGTASALTISSYSRGLICAWYCICTDYIQLTHFWILSKTISSRIFFFFTFCFEVYHELFVPSSSPVISSNSWHYFSHFCTVLLSYRDNTSLLSQVYFTEDVLNIFKTLKAVFIFDMFFFSTHCLSREAELRFS